MCQCDRRDVPRRDRRGSNLGRQGRRRSLRHRRPGGTAKELAALGVDYIYLHYGYDQQNETPEGNRTIDQIREIKDAVDVPVGVVTFDPETGVRAVEAGADILLVSHPYLIGDGAETGLTDYVRQVKAAGSRR